MHFNRKCAIFLFFADQGCVTLAETKCRTMLNMTEMYKALYSRTSFISLANMKHGTVLFIISALLAVAGSALARIDPIIDVEDKGLYDSSILKKALLSKSPAVRVKAAYAYGRIGVENTLVTVDPLLDLLDDHNINVKTAAVFNLGQLGWSGQLSGAKLTEVVAKVKATLSSANPSYISMALEAIGKLALDQTEGIVVPFMKSSNPSVQYEAITALWRRLYVESNQGVSTSYNDTAATVQSVLDLTKTHQNVLVRQAIANYLRTGHTSVLREAVMSAIRTYLSDKDEFVRSTAVASLGSKGDSTDVTQLIKIAMSDASYMVRYSAVTSISQLGAIVNLLEKKRTDSTFHVRAALVDAISATTELTAAVNNTIASLLKDNSPTVRVAAAGALVRNMNESDVFTFLKSIQNDKSWLLREAAVNLATGVLTNDHLWEIASVALKDKDANVRAAAYENLGHLSPAFSAIERGLREPGLATRENSADALAQRTEPTTAQVGLAAFKSSPGYRWADFRTQIVQEVWQPRSTEEVQKYLLDAVADPFNEVSQAAHDALVSQNYTSLIPHVTPPKLTFSPYRDLTFRRDPKIELVTNKGTMVLRLYHESAPIHVASIVGLVKSGYYNGLIWHRVVSDFVIQGGDKDGSGYGDDGWKLRAEINPIKYERGTLGMPRSTSFSSGGSQLFISHLPVPFLDGQYTVFGQVVAGFDAIDRIERSDFILHAKLL
ncbi:hypothetical protein BC937DRAFT_89612 [Endogone sp. FLAS-F59071]|nr:hypothetical protein BC937DRAFT_89612 [Endogone sp. FLAS-F59071]|eukprot:RUS17686.1 hypothetical protein BC937DRAFT_89612 [Endogone sp. FLAS-F59071]